MDDQWLLTAAHCVADDNGDVVDWDNDVWCTLENLDENTNGGFESECFEVDSVTVYGGFGGSPAPIDDFAVVKLDGYPDVGGWFAISTASDSAIASATDYTAGYPRKNAGCADNSVTNSNLVTNDTWNGRQLRVANGSVQSSPAGQFKFDTSTAKGMSGGLHYYCGENSSCSSGSSHWLTAVVTNYDMNFCSGITDFGTCWGNSCSSGYSTGPKGPDIRTWVINNTP